MGNPPPPKKVSIDLSKGRAYVSSDGTVTYGSGQSAQQVYESKRDAAIKEYKSSQSSSQPTAPKIPDPYAAQKPQQQGMSVRDDLVSMRSDLPYQKSLISPTNEYSKIFKTQPVSDPYKNMMTPLSQREMSVREDQPFVQSSKSDAKVPLIISSSLWTRDFVSGRWKQDFNNLFGYNKAAQENVGRSYGQTVQGAASTVTFGAVERPKVQSTIPMMNLLVEKPLESAFVLATLKNPKLAFNVEQNFLKSSGKFALIKTGVKATALNIPKAAYTYDVLMGVGNVATQVKNKEEGLYRSNSAERDFKIGIAAIESAMQNKAQMNDEVRQFNEQQKPSIENEIRAAYQNAGYDYASTEKAVREETPKVFEQTVRDYYVNKGLKGDELETSVARVISGKIGTGFTDYGMKTPLGTISGRNILYGASLLAGDKKVYAQAIRDYYKGQGLSSSEVEKKVKYAMNYRSTRGAAEIGTNLYLGSQSEGLGRKLFSMRIEQLARQKVAVSTKDAGFKLFKEGFKIIAPLGVYEGGYGQYLQQNIRAKERNWKEVAVWGGVGGISAGLLGGGIVGTSINKKVTSKGLELFSNVADPYEYGGDTLRNMIGYGEKRVFKAVIPQPKLFISGAKTSTLSFSPEPFVESPSIQQNFITSKSGFNNVQSFIGSIIPPMTPIPTSVPTKTESKVQTQIKPPIKINVNPPLPVDIFKPSPPVPVPVSTKTQVQTIIDSTVPISTQVGIPVSVSSPIYRFPIPLPIPVGGLNFGGVGSGGGRQAPKKFIDELEAGRKLLKGLTSFGSMNQKGFGITMPKLKVPKIKLFKTKRKKAKK